MQCAECQTVFELTAQDSELLERVQAPTPTRCPNCRLQRRLAFWPFGKFHQRLDSLTEQPLVSVFSPAVRFPVTDRNNWYSDTWEAPTQEIDWNRSFLEQLQELQEDTPHFHMLGDDKNVNSDYADDIWSCKDCYYCRSMYKVENSYYVYRLIESHDCIDCTYSFKLENCYENTYCFANYNTQYALDSRNCLDSYFLYDCRGTRNSFMCWNVRNKEYCIRNKQYSQEEYAQKLNEIQFSSWTEMQALKAEFLEHIQVDALHRARYMNNCEISEGNYLDNCVRVSDAFFFSESENCGHAFRGIKNKECLDATGSLVNELNYEVIQSVECYNVKYSSMAIRCKDSEYLDQCVDLSNCFGCVGLKKKKFAILNKEYSQADYEQLRQKLVKKMQVDGEYGEMLPYSMMYTGYNQTLSQYYFPETKLSIKAKQGYWEDDESSSVDAQSVNGLPEISANYSSYVGTILRCPVTAWPYRLIEQELEFYDRNTIPIPQLHPDERNRRRFVGLIPGITPRQMKCARCQQAVTTYYPTDWKYAHIVCEPCYQATIY